MGILLDLNFWGLTVFDDDIPIRNIKLTEYKSSILDEVEMRQRTDIDTSNIKSDWQNDTQLLAKFMNSLEAGNVNNDGVKIVKFAISRRSKNETKELTLGEVDFINNSEMEFTDVTQPNSELVYTVIPIGENGLPGTPKEVEFNSEFVGYWLVDKDTNEVLGFDKAIGSMGNVDTTFNQTRNVIETFSKYPQIYYGNSQEYESFTLTATFLPEDGERSGDIHNNILNSFVRQHKPFLIKGSNGKMYVSDISNPRFSSPQNAGYGYDYVTVSIDCVEVMDLYEYLEGDL